MKQSSITPDHFTDPGRSPPRRVPHDPGALDIDGAAIREESVETGEDPRQAAFPKRMGEDGTTGDSGTDPERRTRPGSGGRDESRPGPGDRIGEGPSAFPDIGGVRAPFRTDDHPSGNSDGRFDRYGLPSGRSGPERDHRHPLLPSCRAVFGRRPPGCRHHAEAMDHDPARERLHIGIGPGGDRERIRTRPVGKLPDRAHPGNGPAGGR